MKTKEVHDRTDRPKAFGIPHSVADVVHRWKNVVDKEMYHRKNISKAYGTPCDLLFMFFCTCSMIIHTYYVNCAANVYLFSQIFYGWLQSSYRPLEERILTRRSILHIFIPHCCINSSALAHQFCTLRDIGWSRPECGAVNYPQRAKAASAQRCRPSRQSSQLLVSHGTISVISDIGLQRSIQSNF